MDDGIGVVVYENIESGIERIIWKKMDDELVIIVIVFVKVFGN